MGGVKELNHQIIELAGLILSHSMALLSLQPVTVGIRQADPSIPK